MAKKGYKEKYTHPEMRKDSKGYATRDQRYLEGPIVGWLPEELSKYEALCPGRNASFSFINRFRNRPPNRPVAYMRESAGEEWLRSLPRVTRASFTDQRASLPAACGTGS